MSDRLFNEETGKAAREEEKTEETGKELNDVLQQVSGQLRQSLGNIHSALLRLAPPDARDGDQKTDLDAAVLCQSYYRILRLTNNLADAAGAGQPAAVRLKNGDIVAFCREVMERAEQPAELLRIRTEFRCKKKSHVIAMDRKCLERMLLNLLSNAFKFIRPDEDEKVVTLEVKVERDFVRLVLTDTGVGMTEEEQATAFDRWRQPGRQEPPPHGLGYGLYLCRRYAEAHGGSVLLFSEPGVGTTVTVCLPNRRLRIEADEPSVFGPVDIYGGFNRTLVELSDALKKDAFTQKYLD